MSGNIPVVLKVKFPPSSPVITKSFRLSEGTSVGDALLTIRDAVQHSIAVTPSHGLYLPTAKVLLPNHILLGSIKQQLEREDAVELVDRAAAAPQSHPFAYVALGAVLGAATAFIALRYIQYK